LRSAEVVEAELSQASINAAEAEAEEQSLKPRCTCQPVVIQLTSEQAELGVAQAETEHAETRLRFQHFFRHTADLAVAKALLVARARPVAVAAAARWALLALALMVVTVRIRTAIVRPVAVAPVALAETLAQVLAEPVALVLIREHFSGLAPRSLELAEVELEPRQAEQAVQVSAETELQIA